MPDIVGYYQQLHFQLNELELFYNLPIYDENITTRFSKCHHISKLICSHAKQFSSTQCIEDRKCQLYHNKKKLFTDNGIHAPTLLKIDDELRSK